MSTKPLAAWIESWPWTKTLVAAGVIGFILSLALSGLGMLLVVVVPDLRVVGAAHLALLAEARAWTDNGMQWSLIAATGGVAGLVGKRFSTKPEVVAAEAAASVKVIEATAKAVPPLTGEQAVAAARVPMADEEAATGTPTVVTIKPYADPER